MKKHSCHPRHLLLLLLLIGVPAQADPLLYRIEGDRGTVWLLGSVHALGEDEYPLDARIESAYDAAERVVLEVDPNELDPAHLAGIAMQLARFDDRRTLSGVFSDDEYETLRQGFAGAGLDIALLEPFEPWFAGLQLLSINLLRHGFGIDQGVDRHFAERALADGKATAGLETAREQLQLFDKLPMDAQKAFLLEAVADSSEFDEQMRAVVSAWRRGDERALAGIADEAFSRDAGLREILLGHRNQRWAKQISTYLATPETTLVVVGALHLVGDDGLVRLLEDAGHEVRQAE